MLVPDRGTKQSLSIRTQGESPVFSVLLHNSTDPLIDHHDHDHTTVSLHLEIAMQDAEQSLSERTQRESQDCMYLTFFCITARIYSLIITTTPLFPDQPPSEPRFCVGRLLIALFCFTLELHSVPFLFCCVVVPDC